MGNNSSRESRGGDPNQNPPRFQGARLSDVLGGPQTHSDRPSSSRIRDRVSRGDLGGLLSLSATGSSTATPDAPYERRESRQEREARRHERERQARIKERERSMKEEHVDGGYLVTLGTYTGIEDFSKPIVRQLQIERRLAPFWRGLNDLDDQWTEHQIIAAARGLPIPAPRETPPEDLIPRPPPTESPAASTQNLNKLTVPFGDGTISTGSDKGTSNLGSSLQSPTGNPGQSARTSSTPFKATRGPAKAIAAALSVSSRNNSQTDITPREIQLPRDPLVNGQPVEVILYKDAAECPICFLTYPPYLNHTRCCDQPICSECFVQIKRPDPHYPDNHDNNNNNADGTPNPPPGVDPDEAAEQLISEPACCPYCQQGEFGVTYEAPPFRRGLAYSTTGSHLHGISGSAAMSSSSSLNSPGLSHSSAGLASPARRRTQSLSANSPNVITTDRVRPDWATKLATQRAHQARRAAAATALHTAAFLMGNEQSRGLRGRFSRRNTGSGSGTGNGNNGETSMIASAPRATEAHDSIEGPQPGPRVSSGGVLSNRRSRMEELEDMMFMEAVRLSLAAEEERKRKAEKEDRKEQKKKDKEERKAAKKAAKQGGSSSNLAPAGNGPYGGSGASSASGSTLSLSGLGFGRRRGNSVASNLRLEATTPSAGAMTGVGVDAGHDQASAPANGKGKGVDRRTVDEQADAGVERSVAPGAASFSARPIASPQPPAGRSHLRQMSNASSVSTLNDSQAGSYTGPSHLDASNRRASGISVGGKSEEGDRDNSEPMFNFNSLAQVVGVHLEGENAGRAIGQESEFTSTGGNGERKPDEAGTGGRTEHVERVGDGVGENVATLRHKLTSDEAPGKAKPMTGVSTPELMVTPETPAPMEEGLEHTKQLGFEPTPRRVERSNDIAQ